jgi:hypothetical protein
MVTPNEVLRPVHRLLADPRLRNRREGNAAFEHEVVRLKTTLDIGQREPFRSSNEPTGLNSPAPYSRI